MPWTPVFILAIFAFHPWLGYLALTGALVLIAIAIANQQTARTPETAAAKSAMMADGFAQTARDSAETIRANGMQSSMRRIWMEKREEMLRFQIVSSDRVGRFATASKSFRFFLQSAILGLAAFLVLHDEVTAGAMIATSVLLGRALAPVEQAIGGWPVVIRARKGWCDLAQFLAEAPNVAKPNTKLPRPTGYLDVDQITVFPPDHRKATLRLVSFQVEPGQALGVVGASASGKSTLARVLTGVWRPASGSVRLDAATLDQYDPEELGRHIGYLPQDVSLFDGTVAENISRFDGNRNSDAIIEAAKRAGADEMIRSLPDGYDTPVYANGARLSGGQRQRLGLARAFYGNPVLLVLDEPDASLNSDGIEAFNRAIRGAKAEGKSLIITAHRQSGISECTHLLLLDGGVAKAVGTREDMLRA